MHRRPQKQRQNTRRRHQRRRLDNFNDSSRTLPPPSPPTPVYNQPIPHCPSNQPLHNQITDNNYLDHRGQDNNSFIQQQIASSQPISHTQHPTTQNYINVDPLPLISQFDLTRLINDYHSMSTPIANSIHASIPYALNVPDNITHPSEFTSPNISLRLDPNNLVSHFLQGLSVAHSPISNGSTFVPNGLINNEPLGTNLFDPIAQPGPKISHVESPLPSTFDQIPEKLLPLLSSITTTGVVKEIKEITHPWLESISSVHLLKGYLTHPISEVRIATLETMNKLHTLAPVSPLDGQLYVYIVPVLVDPNPDIRILASKLVRHIANTNPSFPVPVCPELAPSMDSTNVKLTDDAFSRVSALAQDPDWQVRYAAALELGSFTDVSLPLLLQSLSKKLLNADGTFVQSLARGTIKLTCEWMPFTGAFVHLMEDDREEVRMAALDAISCLANSQILANSQFSQRSVSFLLDMTNDEVASVRIRALTILFTVSNRTPVNLNELDLGNMGDLFLDPSYSMRLDLYRFLGTVVCKDSKTLRCLVIELRRSIDRYCVSVAANNVKVNELKESSISEFGHGFSCRGELESIMKCFRGVAELNSNLVAEEMFTILKLDSRFLRKEVRPSDVHHAALVILIYNAVIAKPEHLCKIPKFIRRQINYFRHRYPESIPAPSDSKTTLTDTHRILDSSNLQPLSQQSPAEIVVQSLSTTLVQEIQHFLDSPSGLDTSLKTKLAAIRSEWKSLPTCVLGYDTLHALIDLGTLLLAAMNKTSSDSDVRHSAAALSCRYRVMPKSGAENVMDLSPLRETGNWSNLWLAASNASNPKDMSLGAIRQSLTWDMFKFDIVRLDWSLSFVYCQPASKQIRHIYDDPAPRVPAGFIIELQIKVVSNIGMEIDCVGNAKTIPISRYNSKTNTLSKHSNLSVTQSGISLHDHGHPVVAQIVWPHGELVYHPFRSRPCLTAGEEHGLIRAGPRAWTSPSALTITVGWLIENDSSESMNVKTEPSGGLAHMYSRLIEAGDIHSMSDSAAIPIHDNHGVNVNEQFIPATNTVSVDVKFN